jgi:hypothetical protein
MSGDSLAACAYDWVGGNFAGLKLLEGQCSAVAAAVAGSDRALSQQVSEVVSAGGWSGAAANAFTAAWDRDSTAGAQLAGAWQQIGAIAGNLAAVLASLESALEQAAYQLEKQGVAIDPATGAALPGTTANGLACPSPQVAAANAALAAPYSTYRTQILDQASVARAEAALALDAITESMLPSQPDYGDPVNGLDAVRGLWALPTVYRKDLPEALVVARKTTAVTQDAAWQNLLAKKAVSGSGARLDPKVRASAAKALREQAALQGELDNAPPETPLSAGADGDAALLGLTGVAGGAVRAIPFIGSTVGAGITVWQDREEGESWKQSLIDGAASSSAALVAGLGVGAVIGTGSVAAIAAGVIGGGVLAVGAGDFVHNLAQEHWTAEWQAHGVLAGTLDGTKDAAVETGHQALHLLSDLNPF